QASFSDTEQELFGKTLDFRTRVTAGDHWVAVAIPRLFEGLPASYGGPNPSTRSVPPPREFKPPPNLPAERVEASRKRIEEDRRRVRPSHGARVGHLEIGGPYDQVTGPLPGTRERIFVCGHPAGSHVEGCARRIVTNLARRAYRRPVGDADVEPLLGLFRQAHTAGDSFDQGIALALQAILVSPDFLFRIEQDRAPGDGIAPIGPHELATRLSYFLWASMPDEELMAKADAGTLGDPAVLEAEVRRMLRDERAMSLVREFGGQWLQIRALENVNPDVEKY